MLLRHGAIETGPGLARNVRHRTGVSVLAVVTAGMVAPHAVARCRGGETLIEGFAFGCETADGRIVKPRHGDIEGMTYSDLPAQRPQCLGTIDRKIALCRENTEFATESENQEFDACLSVFQAQARACVGHFSFERSKCGAGRS